MYLPFWFIFYHHANCTNKLKRYKKPARNIIIIGSKAENTQSCNPQMLKQIIVGTIRIDFRYVPMRLNFKTK